jgi:hypothetical protein
LSIAEDIDSPLVVTRAESGTPGIIYSRDVGREINFLQGPGESPDINGEGSGVTSAIALSMGDDKAEFGADPICEPAALLSAFFMLGVLGGGAIGFCGRFSDSTCFRVEELSLS